MKLIFLLIFDVLTECPEGWKDNKINKKCYKPFEAGYETSWQLAESVCQSYGGDITPLLDESEKNYVYSILNRRSYDYYWIGLNDIKNAGAHEWITTDGR